MTTPRLKEPHPRPTLERPWIDPRGRPDFRPELFPSVAGRPAPEANSTDRRDLMLIRFAAAYYEINRQYARLQTLRAAAESPNPAAERPVMLDIEKGLQLRDHLEDLYAPFGVIVEPVMESGYAVDLRWSSGNTDGRGAPRSELVTIRAVIPIPLPAGREAGDYLTGLEMPEGLE